MPRYAGLGSGPSLGERVLSAILQAIGKLLSLLGVGGLHLHIPVWVWLGIAIIAILFVILWPIRSGLTLEGRSAHVRASPSVARRPSLDFFADADRHAAAGEYGTAIRALAGGVAVRLSGERAWDQSPYTVRELFARADHPETLRALLRSFEDASYGDHAPDRESYRRAVEAAQPFRTSVA